MEQWQEIAGSLKSMTWDITEDWLEEAKNDLIISQNFLSLPDEEIISDLPSLIGGIANVVQDPVYLEDFQLGGHIHSLAQDLGRSRQFNGYQIEKVLSDFSLLRQKIWSCCKNKMQLKTDVFYELEQRINSAIDKIAEATIQGYHQKSSIELIELAYKDKLTGFYHLKALMQIVDEELLRAKRYHRPLSFAVLDIDRFREFNRRNGRLAGNQLLQEIARNIIQHVRATDKAARLGGDEFGILMPETEIEAAKQAIERVRRQIKQETRRNETMATLSIGVASYPKNVSASDELMRESRLSLVRAQKDGGDTISLSTKKSPEYN